MTAKIFLQYLNFLPSPRHRELLFLSAVPCDNAWEVAFCGSLREGFRALKLERRVPQACRLRHDRREPQEIIEP